MAEKTGNQAAPQDDLLSAFLGGLEQLPRAISEGMLRQCEDENERLFIRSFATPLERQLSELVGFIRERERRASVQQIQEVNRTLRLSSAVNLVESGTTLAANLASPVARLGVLGIIQIIKKIIKDILPRLGVSLPELVNTLISVIDEILKFLLSGGSSQLASTFSRMERDFLAELTQLSRLQRADRLLSELREDDETET